MRSLTTLYDEYIDRKKLSEQKKPVECIVPPPSREVGTMKNEITTSGAYGLNVQQEFRYNNRDTWRESKVLFQNKYEVKNK